MAHKKLTDALSLDTIMEAAKENMFGLGNIGFCRECGAERDGCEPDARNYECYDCGEKEVFGAEELLVMYG